MKFIPITSIHAQPDVMHVTITKQGVMNVLQSDLYPELKDKYVQIYMTPENRNILGWTLHEIVPLETVRDFNKVMLLDNKKYAIACRKALQILKKFGTPYNKIPVKKVDDKSLLSEGKVYYYVELK